MGRELALDTAAVEALCRRLMASEVEPYFDRLVALDQPQGLRLETSRLAISADRNAGGDLVRMAYNVRWFRRAAGAAASGSGGRAR